MQNSYNQPTMPNPALNGHKPAYVPPAPPLPPVQQPTVRRTAKKKNHYGRLLLGAFVAIMMVSVLFVVAVMLIVGMIYGQGILPGVNAAGISLGGMSEAEAIAVLNQRWQVVTLADGARTWNVESSLLGIRLDAGATAAKAYAQGRDAGDMFSAMLGRVDVLPVVSVDEINLRNTLMDLSMQMVIEPVNAGVEFTNGQVRATPPSDGRVLDVPATISHWQQNPQVLSGSQIPLVMRSVAPSVTDASPLVAEASRLLSSALVIDIFDPVTGDSISWEVQPGIWGQWVTAMPDSASSIGLSLSLDNGSLSSYLRDQAAITFDPSRMIDIDATARQLQTEVESGRMAQVLAQVKHQPRQHVVQSGESITSIAWDYGVPYLYIQQVNNGLQSVSVGQTITIPPADAFFERPVVPHKRIKISLSNQYMWAYENGVVKWEWGVSTGISDSPTWPGLYQVLSHEGTAYAGNWDLWMPYFISIYKPIPGSNFTNGFHGFPTRGGGQLLWENSIGRRVTYGCILVSNTNVSLLYDWAEDGVVVEIVP